MSTSKASTKAIVAQRSFQERYPVERIVGFARWLMDQMAA
jgi:hypothetical protein